MTLETRVAKRESFSPEIGQRLEADKELAEKVESLVERG